MKVSRATLDRHAKLIRTGHRTYCRTECAAEKLASFVDREYDVRTETVRNGESIVVQAVNWDLLREFSAV